MNNRQEYHFSHVRWSQRQGETERRKRVRRQLPDRRSEPRFSDLGQRRRRGDRRQATRWHSASHEEFA